MKKERRTVWCKLWTQLALVIKMEVMLDIKKGTNLTSFLMDKSTRNLLYSAKKNECIIHTLNATFVFITYTTCQKKDNLSKGTNTKKWRF